MSHQGQSSSSSAADRLSDITPAARGETLSGEATSVEPVADLATIRSGSDPNGAGHPLASHQPRHARRLPHRDGHPCVQQRADAASGYHLVRLCELRRAWRRYLTREPPSNGRTVFDITLPKGSFDGFRFCWGGWANSSQTWDAQQQGLVLFWPDVRDLVLQAANYLRTSSSPQRFELWIDLGVTALSARFSR